MNLYALTVSKFPTTNIYNEIALLYEYTTSQDHEQTTCIISIIRLAMPVKQCLNSKEH